MEPTGIKMLRDVSPKNHFAYRWDMEADNKENVGMTGYVQIKGRHVIDGDHFHLFLISLDHSKTFFYTRSTIGNVNYL